MTDSYDLNQLDSNTFEHLVNFLALKVLGNGITGFAQGPDAGRDGYLIGRAPYPTILEQWEGTWYIQSKFLQMGLGSRPQSWIVNQVKAEIELFTNGANRNIPDNWIIATNVEPTGVGKTGSFDKIKKIVADAFGKKVNVDIWGRKKILNFLANNESASRYYGHFITPGHIISRLYDDLVSKDKKTKDIIDHLIINQFSDLIYTKLEQAGSNGDNRPKIFELFQDLPIKSIDSKVNDLIMRSLVSSSCNVHKASAWSEFGDGWKVWSKDSRRARVILLKGGPGQGKSTAGQYFSQIQRAAFLLSEHGPIALPPIIEIAKELRKYALKDGYWPQTPRIPIFVELKDYANWFNDTKTSTSIQSYICHKIQEKTGRDISVEKLFDALKIFSWFINFDGLDEVPNDLKDRIANEIITFSNELCPTIDADVLILCTTRPQGYSGQFENLESAVVNLEPLPPEIALSCASSVVKYNRTEDEGLRSVEILKSAMKSLQVRELMTTPLQSHIMAVVVRDGGRPPERRWELFSNFYNVMKKRESLKDFLDINVSKILQENDVLLKSIHDRLGICLHAKAESSNGAEATLDITEFRKLAEQTTRMLQDGNVDETVQNLMEATTERLVFVNTPESSSTVRFDIRQLQEFFAAEFIYTSVRSNELRNRLELICSDSHWREVVHFALSALSNDKRLAELALAIDTLAKADDHIEDPKIRGYKKRLATGALSALRLLIEGVLEQDKRIRHQFSKVIQPLWGIIDLEMYTRISSIYQEQSRAWLINNMIDNLLELDHSENIAAGYLLTVMLPESHERFEQARNKILNSPENYLNKIIEMSVMSLSYPSRLNVLEMNNWFMKDLISIVIFDKNKKMETYNSCIKAFEIFHNKFEACSVHDDFKSTDIELLIEIIQREKERKNFIHRDLKEHHINYGMIQVSKYQHSWVTGTTPDNLDDIILTDKECSPLLELIKSIVIFSRKRDLNSYNKSLSLFINNKYDNEGIPGSIRALIPIDFENYDIKKHVSFMSEINEAELGSLLNTQYFRNYEFSPIITHAMLTHKKHTMAGWGRLCNHFPLIPLQLWANSFHEQFDVILKNEGKIHNSIVKQLLSYPKFSSSYILLWGDLFSRFPEKEKELRKVFLENIDSPKGFSGYASRKIVPFEIDLKTELLFLIPLSHALTPSKNLFEGGGTFNTRRIKYKNSDIESFGLNNDILLKISRDNEAKPTIRIAALSIYVSQAFDGKIAPVENFFDAGLDHVFVNLTNHGDNESLVTLLYVLFSDVAIDTPKKMSFIGNITNIFKDDLAMREKIQELYSRWRERSSAPVQNSGELINWLEYSY